MTTNKEAKGPYTVDVTIPEGGSYTLFAGENYALDKNCTSGFWDDNSKGPISAYSKAACTEKPEEVKASDISYEEYMRVIHENTILKQIIIELNVLLFKEDNNDSKRIKK